MTVHACMRAANALCCTVACELLACATFIYSSHCTDLGTLEIVCVVYTPWIRLTAALPADKAARACNTRKQHCQPILPVAVVESRTEELAVPVRSSSNPQSVNTPADCLPTAELLSWFCNIMVAAFAMLCP